jgi:CheY-like chemotaxis protein
MSKKRVIDCGNCGPDHSSISRLLRSLFDVEIVQTHTGDETIAELERQRAHLVLVNRKLDIDYSDGLQVIELLKASERFSNIPVMLVTNHEEYQQQAIAAGALYGFGKLELNSPKTKERLTAVLGGSN